jgi:pimeloyl-ACP methyl ester carboxylesterase
MPEVEAIHAAGRGILINLNGVSICYDDFGTGTIPIIFIHGFPFDKSSWEPQLEFLSQTQRVIAYDIRGFGKSSVGDEEQTISLFAGDLIRLMDALQIPQAIVCGLSMGGYIVLNAVTRHPERFKAIILSDTQCIADTPEVKANRYKTIYQINEQGLNGFTENFIKNIFADKTYSTNNELVENIKAVILSNSAKSVTATLTAIAERVETCSLLMRNILPTLILCGTEDKLTPFVQSEFLSITLKNSKLHSIENAGHLSNLEQPDEFNKCISDFISGLAQ